MISIPAFPMKRWAAALAVLSLAWAAGAHFAYPRLEAHLRAEDWAAAAEEADIRGNPERSAAQRQLLLAAAAVVERGADVDTLYMTPDAVPARVAASRT